MKQQERFGEQRYRRGRCGTRARNVRGDGSVNKYAYSTSRGRLGEGRDEAARTWWGADRKHRRHGIVSEKKMECMLSWCRRVDRREITWMVKIQEWYWLRKLGGATLTPEYGKRFSETWNINGDKRPQEIRTKVGAVGELSGIISHCTWPECASLSTDCITSPW